jgi:ABC-type phosphate/phosphonate transport system substrate-binding protein
MREQGMKRPEELRFVTYLSPGIPQAFFEADVEHVRRALGRRASLSLETQVSGPMRGGDDPFSKGEADVGFVCAPSFFCLREMKNPPVELLPAAPVFSDGRAPGRPVYFSEVLVRRESPASSFLDLRGSSWAYNDPCSLSGYYNLLKKLAEMGENGDFFGRVCCSGSHLESMGMICRGETDATAIDSNVLRIKLKSSPELGKRLRVIESWGPFP